MQLFGNCPSGSGQSGSRTYINKRSIAVGRSFFKLDNIAGLSIDLGYRLNLLAFRHYLAD